MNNEIELTAALLTIEKSKEASGCPADVDLQDWLKKLAAENVALKKFCKNAAFDADYEAELGMEKGGFTDALNDIETPATDRIVAGIKADGVEMFALMFAEEAIKDNNITTGWKARASRAASEYADLLREGAGK